MRLKSKYAIGLGLLLGAAWLIWQFYPTILFKVSEWQRQFNLELSQALKSLQANRTQAGFSLIAVSFLYGVFHAVGPGHGKFILTSYLALEQTKLSQAIRISLVSAIVQGLVAIALVTIVVAIFTLSRQYFNLTLQWIERGSFAIMIAFGSYWLYQAWRELLQLSQSKRLKVKKILQISPENRPLTPRFSVHHSHSEHCGCGHRHLPSSKEMAQAIDWQSRLMLVLSIGLRPCSGAVLVLFLAYTQDLYYWGVFSALAMAMGTGLTLSLFALMVLMARNRAVQMGKWYLSFGSRRSLGLVLKCLAGLCVMLLGITLFHSSFLISSGSLLFKR